MLLGSRGGDTNANSLVLCELPSLDHDKGENGGSNIGKEGKKTKEVREKGRHREQIFVTRDERHVFRRTEIASK